LGGGAELAATGQPTFQLSHVAVAGANASAAPATNGRVEWGEGGPTTAWSASHVAIAAAGSGNGGALTTNTAGITIAPGGGVGARGAFIVAGVSFAGASPLTLIGGLAAGLPPQPTFGSVESSAPVNLAGIGLALQGGCMPVGKSFTLAEDFNTHTLTGSFT